MAAKTSPSPSDPQTSVPSGAAALMILQFIVASCTQMSAKAKEFFGSVTAPDKKVVWGPHLPMAAEVIADMIELAPTLFNWFTRTPAWLRTTVIEIKLLTEIISYLDALSTLFSNLLQQRRVDLAVAVADMKGGVDGILASKLTPPDAVNQLTEVSQPLMDILNKRNSVLKAKSKSAKSKGQQMKGLEDQVQQLGGTPAVAPKRGRKTPRTLH